MGWILFFMFVVGGIVAYQYLTVLEKEIRAEIGGAEEDEPLAGQPSDLPRAVPAATSELTLAQRIEFILRANPAILQTAFYKEIEDIDRKVLQKELLELDRSGRISRVRSGSTFQLFLKE